MTWTYTGDPSVSDIAAVRFEIQDTNANNPLLQDAEVAYAVLQETGQAASLDGVVLIDGPLYAAAARCCEVLARQFAMQADTETGTLKATYSTAAQTYATRAAELRAKASGYNAPYAGGQSWSEKEGWQQDPDTVNPSFRRGEWNNPYAGSWNDNNSFDVGALPPMGDD